MNHSIAESTVPLRKFALDLHVPHSQIDDLVQQVIIKALELSSVGRWNPTNPEAYLRTMLKNAYFSLRRKQQREVFTDEDAFPVIPTQETDDASATLTSEAPDVQTRITQAIQPLFERVYSTRPELYRAPLKQSWAQILELVFAGVNDTQIDLEAIITRDEKINRAADPQGFVKARNKVFKNHQRTREALAEENERRRNAREITDEVYEETRQILGALIRCQSTKREESTSLSASTKRTRITKGRPE